jgi:uncharacterized protein with GYD domain
LPCLLPFLGCQIDPHPLKESAKRLDLGKKKLKEMGGEIKAFYLTTGSYDMLAIVEVPNDATLAKHLLSLASQGNLRTQAVRALTEDECRGIVGRVIRSTCVR